MQTSLHLGLPCLMQSCILQMHDSALHCLRPTYDSPPATIHSPHPHSIPSHPNLTPNPFRSPFASIRSIRG